MRAAVFYEVGTVPVVADFKETEPDDRNRQAPFEARPGAYADPRRA